MRSPWRVAFGALLLALGWGLAPGTSIPVAAAKNFKLGNSDKNNWPGNFNFPKPNFNIGNIGNWGNWGNHSAVARINALDAEMRNRTGRKGKSVIVACPHQNVRNDPAFNPSKYALVENLGPVDVIKIAADIAEIATMPGVVHVCGHACNEIANAISGAGDGASNNLFNLPDLSKINAFANFTGLSANIATALDANLRKFQFPSLADVKGLFNPLKKKTPSEAAADPQTNHKQKQVLNKLGDWTNLYRRLQFTPSARTDEITPLLTRYVGYANTIAVAGSLAAQLTTGFPAPIVTSSLLLPTGLAILRKLNGPSQ